MFRKTIATLATGLAALMMAGMAHARDQIQIVGSSTVYPFATVVAEIACGDNLVYAGSLVNLTAGY